jgi:hypothetical protein
MHKSKPQPKPDFYILVMAAGLSCLVSIMDFSGALGSIPWLAERITTFTLLLVSMTLGYLVTERRGKLDVIETSINVNSQKLLMTLEDSKNEIARLIESGSDNVRVFDDPKSMYEELILATKQATSSIDISSFGLSNPAKPELTDPISSIRAKYYQELSLVIKTGIVRVRRVLLVRNNELLSWVQEMITEFRDSPLYIGCYVGKLEIPLLSVMVIDNDRVYLTVREQGLSFRQKAMLIRNKKFVEAIQEYYNLLWRQSQIVKELEVNEPILSNLRNSIHAE